MHVNSQVRVDVKAISACLCDISPLWLQWAENVYSQVLGYIKFMMAAPVAAELKLITTHIFSGKLYGM